MRWLWILLVLRAWGQTRESIEKQMQSIERQRDAVRKQGEAAGVSLEPVAEPPPPKSDCAPMPEEAVKPMIESAAREQRLPARLLRAVIARESGFRACAVSKKGARGLMQLMPATAAELALKDPFDAAANVAAGARYLRRMLERFKGDLPLSLAAYNAGPGVVDEAVGVPEIAETRDYVAAIVKDMGVKQIDLPSIPTPKPTGN
jgi:soluble lytic murein transglycosylase-like protein